MRKRAAVALLVVVWMVSHPIAASQRSGPPKVNTVRLYAFDGGLLTVGEPTGFGLTKAEVKATDMAVPAFLVVHPRGSLLWDTGLGDHLVGRPASETSVGAFGQTVVSPLKAQLMAIGYTPSAITYLALSHMHFDHVGNANDYAGATWLVQRTERAAMFNDQPPAGGTPPRYSALRDAKTIVLDGDRDVFEDGTVIIKSTPGHTPGHQSLYLKLAKSGPLVLSGDLYHYPEERTLNRMPAREAAAGQTAASRVALEQFMKSVGADLWIQHDLLRWQRSKKAPDYYE